MADEQPQFLTVGSGREARRIAYLQQPAAEPGRPGLIWLCGLKSDMVSTKASARGAMGRRAGPRPARASTIRATGSRTAGSMTAR